MKRRNFLATASAFVGALVLASSCPAVELGSKLPTSIPGFPNVPVTIVDCKLKGEGEPAWYSASGEPCFMFVPRVGSEFLCGVATKMRVDELRNEISSRIKYINPENTQANDVQVQYVDILKSDDLPGYFAIIFGCGHGNPLVSLRRCWLA